MKGKAIQLIDHTDDGDVFDLKISIFKDSSNKILSGLTVGPTLEQNKALILIFHPGYLKERPYVGVGLSNILLGGDLLEYRHKIRKNFSYDGLKISDLKFYNVNSLSIKANY